MVDEKRELANIASGMAETLKKKHVTTSQVIYINNKVLLPRLLYRVTCLSLNQKECEDIQRPILKVLK